MQSYRAKMVFRLYHFLILAKYMDANHGFDVDDRVTKTLVEQCRDLGCSSHLCKMIDNGSNLKAASNLRESDGKDNTKPISGFLIKTSKGFFYIDPTMRPRKIKIRGLKKGFQPCLAYDNGRFYSLTGKYLRRGVYSPPYIHFKSYRSIRGMPSAEVNNLVVDERHQNVVVVAMKPKLKLFMLVLKTTIHVRKLAYVRMTDMRVYIDKERRLIYYIVKTKLASITYTGHNKKKYRSVSMLKTFFMDVEGVHPSLYVCKKRYVVRYFLDLSSGQFTDKTVQKDIRLSCGRMKSYVKYHTSAICIPKKGRGAIVTDGRKPRRLLQKLYVLDPILVLSVMSDSRNKDQVK